MLCPCGMALHHLSHTYFTAVDAPDMVYNKLTEYRNVDLYHNYLLFCVCEVSSVCAKELIKSEGKFWDVHYVQYYVLFQYETAV